MAIHQKIVLLTCLLSLILVMGDVKPISAKKGGGRKQRMKVLEKSVKELKEKMNQQEGIIKNQGVKMNQQEEIIRGQDQRIKTLEGCKACSKIEELNKLITELKEEVESKPEIDECTTNTHSCDTNAVCINTPESYTCKCKAGYSGDGKSCADIDECVSGENDCHANALCANTEGSYKCSCKPPYSGDGKNCTQLPEECENYQSLTDADRNTNYGLVNGKCDGDLGPGWFRFQGAAGTKMSTSCTPYNRCNTGATGWLDGGHPKVADGVVSRKACFSYTPGCCYQHNYIRVRNCGSFYVYYFNGTPNCSYRFCGTD